MGASQRVRARKGVMRIYRWLFVSLSRVVPRRVCRRNVRALRAQAPRCFGRLRAGCVVDHHVSRNAVERGGRALGHPAAGPSLRGAHAGANARIHSNGHRNRCLGHRREHSGVFGDRFRPHPPAAVSAAGSAGEDLGERAGLHANGAFSGELPRLEESQLLIRGVWHVHHGAVELDRAGRSTAA